MMDQIKSKLEAGQSTTELKIIPAKELNKVMGIRSPELTGSKKQFNKTGNYFNKYKLEGEEDLSEEDVNEEDIL